MLEKLFIAIKWEEGQIVFPDTRTIAVWNGRIFLALGDKKMDITRVPVSNFFSELVIKAMTPLFPTDFFNIIYSRAKDLYGDPFLLYFAQKSSPSGVHDLYQNPPNTSLYNLFQILGVMSECAGPFQHVFKVQPGLIFKLFEKSSLYQKISQLPVIASISETRSLLAFTTAMTGTPLFALNEVANSLSLGTFESIFSPKRFRYFLTCLKRNIEPWQNYLDILPHAWSALVIQNNLLTVDASDVYTLMEMMFSVTTLRNRQDSYPYPRINLENGLAAYSIESPFYVAIQEMISTRQLFYISY